MKHATSRELFDYWNRVRDGAPAPQRGDIEPSDIRRILADTFILECADREHYPIRLAGTRICGLLCREIKGDDFRSLWRNADRDAIATLGTAISSDAAAAVVTVGADTDRGRTLAAEVLMLPLRSGGRANDRIFGSFAPFERPYWVGTEPISTLTIVSLRLIWPDEPPQFLRRAPSVSSDLPPASAAASVPNSRRRGHLTIFDGGKG
jgi:hypothetical protein